MVSSCMKRCSASPIIRELQIKTRYIISYPLERQKDRNNQCRRGCRVKETLMHWWWECKLVHSLWKTLQRFLKNLKLKLLVYYDPAAGCLFTLLIVSFVVPKNVRCSLTCLFFALVVFKFGERFGSLSFLETVSGIYQESYFFYGIKNKVLESNLAFGENLASLFHQEAVSETHQVYYVFYEIKNQII